MVPGCVQRLARPSKNAEFSQGALGPGDGVVVHPHVGSGWETAVEGAFFFKQTKDRKQLNLSNKLKEITSKVNRE